MDGIIRRLKIQELIGRLFLYDLEGAGHRLELVSRATTNERRAAIFLRRPELEIERTEATNDLEWFEAEERLHRPDRKPQVMVS
jgi:hypothetical protein